MAAAAPVQSVSSASRITQLRSCRPEAPLMVVGVTHSQTCMILTSRLRALRRAGFRVVLVCSPGTLLTQTAEAAGVEWIALPIDRSISPASDLLSLWSLWRLLARLRPQITEFSTPKAGLLGTVAARLAGVPHRVYLLRGLRLESARGLKHKILLLAERLAAASAHLVLCNSASLRDEAMLLRLTSANQISVLGDGSSQGVDTHLFSPGPTTVRRELGIATDAPVIGFVGRLTRDKGLPELVEAFAEILKTVPNAHLLLVGWYDAAEDALEPKLRIEIAAHSQIHVTGFVPETASYYRAMDVMVLPTWREGFPNVVLEAAASGLPVVTTLSTGARDAVLPEVTGLLIPPGYPDAIREAVVGLLRDPARRARMGEAARAWVIERYSNERVLGLTVEFYKNLIAE